jgi:hypothetical protein
MVRFYVFAPQACMVDTALGSAHSLELDSCCDVLLSVRSFPLHACIHRSKKDQIYLPFAMTLWSVPSAVLY